MARKKEVTKVEDKRVQDYELVFIVNPEVTEESLESRIDSVSQFITSKDGIISGVDRWGKRKLAYPLAHFLEGSYVLAKFKLTPARCKELEANLKISEDILRHLLVKVGS